MWDQITNWLNDGLHNMRVFVGIWAMLFIAMVALVGWGMFRLAESRSVHPLITGSVTKIIALGVGIVAGGFVINALIWLYLPDLQNWLINDFYVRMDNLRNRWQMDMAKWLGSSYVSAAFGSFIRQLQLGPQMFSAFSGAVSALVIEMLLRQGSQRQLAYRSGTPSIWRVIFGTLFRWMRSEKRPEPRLPPRA